MRLAVFALSATLLSLTPAPAQAQYCEREPGSWVLDIAPRLSPDGEVTIGDVVVLARFAVGLAAPTPQELRRADIAPAPAVPGLSSPTVHVMDPDGRIDVGDLVLAMRVAVRLGVLVHSGGPWIEGLEPGETCTGPGFTVSIFGGRLAPGGHLPAVTVDGSPATIVDHRFFQGYEMLTVLTEGPARPMVPPRGVFVAASVTNALGEATREEAIRVVPNCTQAPWVASASPSVGAADVEGFVVMSGVGLACTLSLTFVHVESGARVSARLIEVHGDLNLISTRPPLPELGFYDLVLTTPCGSHTEPAAFEATLPPDPADLLLEMHVLSPDWGREHLAIPVVIYGTHLADVDRIQWGDVELLDTDFSHLPDGSLLIPAIPTVEDGPLPFPGIIGVQVAAGGDYLPQVMQFAYEASCPATCGSLAPATGAVRGGTNVLITPPWSADVRRVDEVHFGGRPAGSLELIGGFQLGMTAPSVLGPGPVTVELLEAGEVVASCETLFEYR